MSEQIHDASGDSRVWARRKFIRNKLQIEGKISQGTIQQWLAARNEPYSPKAIRGDMEFIKYLDGKIIFEHEYPKGTEKEIVWVDDSRKLGATREQRKGHNQNAKLQIAEVLSSLVTGLKKFQFKISETKKIVQIENLEKILSYLHTFFKATGGDPTKLMARLEAFWADSQRALFLDAGTTTQYFAQDFLQYFELPMESLPRPNMLPSERLEPSINKIEVVTNDRHIFYCLGEQQVNTKTIIVGGRQQFRSAAVSGRMAERFVKSNDLWAGMGIVGISAICLPERRGVSEFFYAENENVAAMKLLFLERSKIKIVIADSSKFRSTGEQGDTRICEIKNNQVDMVITEKANPELIKYFQDRGVALIPRDLVC